MKIKDSEANTCFDKFFFRTLLMFVFLFVILYFYRLGSVGLIDVDEPRYAETGREILESGNWIVPNFNYVTRYDKPILFYWLEAISMKIFGINEFSARLPSVLSALSCVAVVFFFIKTFYSTACGLIGALILMSCFQFAALSRFSVTDMTLANFTCSSIICFFLGYNQILTSHRFFKLQVTEFSFWYLLGFVFLALAVLTKGPVAIIIISLILLPFFWWIRKLDYFFRSKSFWIGFILFLLIVFPWYVAVHLATEGEFSRVFFGLHNFSRYTSTVSGHRGSIFYFIPVVLIGFLPWTFFLPQAISAILKKGLKSLLASTREQSLWFCLWWFLVIFLFFSFSRTKLLTYIMPLFPALSVIVAIWFENILLKQINNKGLMIGLGMFFLFCLVILYICFFNLNVLLPREIKSLKLDLQIVCFAFLMFVGVSMAWASHKDVKMTISIFLSTFLLLYFSLVTLLLPKVDKCSQYLLRTFAKSIPKDVEIGTYQIIKPSLTFYAKRQVKKIDTLTELQNRLSQKEKFAFVTKKNLLNEIFLENSYKWSSDDRYVFFTNYVN